MQLHILHHAAKEGVYGDGMMEELARHGYRLSAGTHYPMLRGMSTAVACPSFWDQLRAVAQAAMRGANAAEVGILAAALCNSVWTSAVLGPADFAAAVAGFVVLIAFRSPPFVVVVLGAAFGITGAVAVSRPPVRADA